LFRAAVSGHKEEKRVEESAHDLISVVEKKRKKNRSDRVSPDSEKVERKRRGYPFI